MVLMLAVQPVALLASVLQPTGASHLRPDDFGWVGARHRTTFHQAPRPHRQTYHLTVCMSAQRLAHFVIEGAEVLCVVLRGSVHQLGPRGEILIQS
jgi:hypothetical protein